MYVTISTHALSKPTVQLIVLSCQRLKLGYKVTDLPRHKAFVLSTTKLTVGKHPYSRQMLRLSWKTEKLPIMDVPKKNLEDVLYFVRK